MMFLNYNNNYMVKEFSKQILQDEIAKGSIIVLDFYAIWCGPCNTFAPTFNQIAIDMGNVAVFGKVNIDEQRDIAILYRISSIPTILIIKNNEIMWQHIGTVDAILLKNKIKSLC